MISLLKILKSEKAKGVYNISDGRTITINLAKLTIGPRIIVLAGTVGSGKSTHMKVLALRLKKGGLRVKTAFLKSGHLLAYLLTIFLVRVLLRRQKNVYPIRALIEEKPYIFGKIFNLWLVFDVLGICIRFLLTIYLPLKMGYIILVEEYLPATIADYIYLAEATGLSQRKVHSAISFLQRLLYLGGPIYTIFFDAPTLVLENRWKFRKTPSEAISYLRMQRTLLLSISKRLSSSFIYIRTDGNIKEIHEFIISYLTGHETVEVTR